MHRDKEKLRDFTDRIKAMKWPKIKPLNKAEQRFIGTIMDAVNTLQIEIAYGDVPADTPPDSVAYLPTASDIELNLKVIKNNLYPLVDLLRRLEPKDHKAAAKHLRHLIDAVGYSYWINPGDDLSTKERTDNWQRRLRTKESESREALTAIVTNITGHEKPLHPYEWIETKLKTINKKLVGMGHAPLVENFADEKNVRNASDRIFCILTKLDESGA